MSRFQGDGMWRCKEHDEQQCQSCFVWEAMDLYRAFDTERAALAAEKEAREKAEKRCENLRASHDFPRLEDVCEIDALRAEVAKLKAARLRVEPETAEKWLA